MGCREMPKFWCQNHDSVLICNGWVMYMHNKCTCKPIINKRQVLERVNILKHNLDKITEYAKAYNLNSEIKNFDAEINQLSVEVRDLDSEMYKAFKNENVSKFTEIYEKALGMKYQIDNNWAIKEYAIFKMNRSMLNDTYSLNDKYRILDKKLKTEIEDHKEKLQKEMEEHKNREVQQEAEKIKEEMNFGNLRTTKLKTMAVTWRMIHLI